MKTKPQNNDLSGPTPLGYILIILITTVVFFAVREKRVKSVNPNDNKCLDKNKIIKEDTYFFEMSDAELKKFQEKFELIKIGMLENQVVQLMGKPSKRLFTKSISFFTFKRSDAPPQKLFLEYYTKRYRENGSSRAIDKCLLFVFKKDQSGVYRLISVSDENAVKVK